MFSQRDWGAKQEHPLSLPDLSRKLNTHMLEMSLSNRYDKRQTVVQKSSGGGRDAEWYPPCFVFWHINMPVYRKFFFFW